MGELSAGSVFAGHRIEAVAGSGGMGVVYRATHLGLGRTVALKVIAAELAADEAFRDRFQRESEIAAGIDHPNVIPVYEAGQEDGALFISMRYVDGTDLGRLVAREGGLEPRRAVEIADQVAYALDAAHGAGLIHRDVKPANVLIEQRPRGEHANLTDFGLSKRAGAKSGLTGTGVFVGTIDYIAPEQVEGKREIDARADIYSLGCVLYHALTGRVPFERDTQIATMFAHATEPPPSAREHAPSVPAALDAVVRRAMAKDPDERHPSAGDFGRAALAAMDGAQVTRAERSVATGEAASGERPQPPKRTETQPTAPPPPAFPAPAPHPPPPAPPRAKSSRRPLLIGGILAMLAAIALVAVLLAGGGGEGGSSPESAEAEIEETVESARQAAAAGDADAFCGYLSSALVETLSANGDINDVVPTCADLVEANSSSVSDAASEPITVSSVENVTGNAEGDTATLTAQLGGTGETRFVALGVPVTVDVVKEGGTWKLGSLPLGGD